MQVREDAGLADEEWPEEGSLQDGVAGRIVGARAEERELSELRHVAEGSASVLTWPGRGRLAASEAWRRDADIRQRRFRPTARSHGLESSDVSEYVGVRLRPLEVCDVLQRDRAGHRAAANYNYKLYI